MPQNAARLSRCLAITLMASAAPSLAAADGDKAPSAIATPSTGMAIETAPRILAPPESHREIDPQGARPALSDGPTLALKSPDWKPQTLLPLAAVLGAILFVAWGIRRFLPSVKTRGVGPLRVIQRVHLSPKQSVALLHVGRRMVLVGVSPDRFSPLSEITDPEECARVLAWSQAGRDATAEFGRLVESESDAYERVPVERSYSRADDGPRLQEARMSVRGVLDRLKAMRVESGAPSEPRSR